VAGVEAARGVQEVVCGFHLLGGGCGLWQEETGWAFEGLERVLLNNGGRLLLKQRFLHYNIKRFD
jgi:hypothetical protein